MSKRTMTVPCDVEAVIVSKDTGTTIGHYAKMIEKGVVIGDAPSKAVNPVDIHGTQCIDEHWEGELRVRCQNPVMPGLAHGYLCQDCWHEQAKVIHSRTKAANGAEIKEDASGR